MNRKKNSILIIDDEPNIIFELTAILEKDYTVFAVVDSLEAVETVEENIPDVILLDLFMPEMDGFDVMQALKESEKTRDIPVILMTGLDSIDAEEKGLTLGAADYISKPFHPAVVNTRVKNQITIKERLRQQTLMTNISHKLLADANAETLFTDTLQMVGEFMNVDQILLYEVEEGSGNLICRYEWFEPSLNLETRINEIMIIDDNMKNLTNELIKKGELCIHSNNPFYREAAKHYRRRHNSFVTSPIYIKDKMCAILDVSREDTEQSWSKSEIDLVVHVSGIFSSVFERNSIEQRFFISEYDLMKYKLTSEALGIALWDMDAVNADPEDPNTVFIWSQETRQMFGFNDEQGFPNVLHSLISRIHPDDYDKVINAFSSHMFDKTGETPFDIEYRVKQKNGDYRYIHAFGTTLRDSEGNPLRVAGAFMDITEAKSMETELNAANKRSMLMLDTSPLCAEIWDKNHMIIDCNEAAVRMYGFNDKQEYKDKFADSCSPEYQPDGRKSIEKATEILNNAFEEGYCIFEWMHKMPYSDTLMPCEVILVRVEYHEDPVVIGYTRDLREQNKMIEDKIEAERATYAKSRFLATMSHEIRTPMNAILGISEIELERKETPPEVKESLHRIYNSGCTLLGIINDLLDLSKIESGNFDILNNEYDTATLLSDTIHLNIMRINNKPVEFIVKIEETLPKTLIGDELRIKQILNNLLSNAFKYTHKGFVTLGVSSEHTSDGVDLILSVQDTGVGLTKDQLDTIFDDYSMFNIEANRTTEGIGLGMGITKNLADMMNGTIKIESEPEVGSTFTVHIPQQEAADSNVIGKDLAEKLQNIDLSSEAQRVQIDRDHMPYGSVLIADDNEANLFVASGLMNPYGLAIETVLSGYEALDRIREGKEYDIVFMDYMMPGMDGIEATRLIRETGYTRPIVALTANAVVGQREVFLEKGFEDFITKPIDIRQLNSVLNTFIRDKYPPEVVNAANSDKGSSENSNTINGDDSNSISLLRKSGDINVDSAIDAMGGLADVYLKTVKLTTRLLPETLAMLDDYYEKQDIPAFTVQVHGLKSVLNNIGATALGKTAAKLEKKAKDDDIEYCNKSYPGFKEALIKLHEQLNEAFSVKSANNRESADKSLLTQVIVDVKAAAEGYDAVLALELIAPHRDVFYDDEIDEMIQNIAFALEEFDCENALEIITKIEDKL